MTGVAEAVESRTAMVVLTAEVAEPTSTFYVDQAPVAHAVGAVLLRIAVRAPPPLSARRSGWLEPSGAPSY